MKKVLLIGENSYLALGFKLNFDDFTLDKIRRPFDKEEIYKYKEYDYIINFCIQPNHFTKILSESEMIDVQIAKNIKTSNTKFVFLSSRKVYGSNSKLIKYSEKDDTNPFDFYSKNKCNIEDKLQNILKNNLLILRTGNIIGDLPQKNNYLTFIGWLKSELDRNNKVIVTVDKNAKKDFITKEYFQEVLSGMVAMNLSGIYNVGAGFGISMDELIKNLIPKSLIFFEQEEKESEQFILNCYKLHKKIRKFTKKELLLKCRELKQKYYANK